MGKKKKRNKVDLNQEQQQAFTHASSPFLNLLKQSSTVSGAATASASSKTPVSEPSSSLQAKTDHPIVVDLTTLLSQLSDIQISHSRAKRSGKTVSIVRCKSIRFNREAHQVLTKALSKFLACRVWIESDMIYVQGDQRQRLKNWMIQHDIPRISITTT